MIDLSLLDILAVVCFIACWSVYAALADRGQRAGRSMTGVMSAYRLRWMREMTRRENRVVDTTILGNQLNGAAFFASTAILLVGGLFAFLGATDQAIAVFEHLPLLATPSRALWEIKILLLIAIFVYAFFKFAWAFRLFNTCSVLVGATALEPTDEAEAERHPEHEDHEGLHGHRHGIERHLDLRREREQGGADEGQHDRAQAPGAPLRPGLPDGGDQRRCGRGGIGHGGSSERSRSRARRRARGPAPAADRGASHRRRQFAGSSEARFTPSGAAP